MSSQLRVWCRVGTLILIALWGSACTSGADLQPVPYATGPTEVDVKTRRMDGPTRYSPPRHASRYHHDATEVDLATAMSADVNANAKTPQGANQPEGSSR